MCKSYDRFMIRLGQAVVEYPAYHRIRRRWRGMSDSIIHDLVRLGPDPRAVLSRRQPARDRDHVDTLARRDLLARLEIAIPADQLFAHQMVRLPWMADHEADLGGRRPKL